MVTQKQKEMIKELVKKVKLIDLAYEVMHNEDKETDKKLKDYQKKIGKDWKYIPNEKEREENIGPVYFSKSRIDLEKTTHEELDKLKILFCKLTNTINEKITMDNYSLYLRIRKLQNINNFNS